MHSPKYFFFCCIFTLADKFLNLSAFQIVHFPAAYKSRVLCPVILRSRGLGLAQGWVAFSQAMPTRHFRSKSISITGSSRSDSHFYLSVEDMLISQGFYWAQVNQSDGLLIQGEPATDPSVLVLVYNGLNFSVSGMSHQFAETVYIAVHKPRGYECSRQPQSGRSVLDLLPAHFHARGVQPVGRLDVGTTGLLLLSDDARFIHHATHPAAAGPPLLKHYRAECASPITDAQLSALAAGVRLAPPGGGPPEERVRRCAELSRDGPRALRLAISEGAFHQVRPALARPTHPARQSARAPGPAPRPPAGESSPWPHLVAASRPVLCRPAASVSFGWRYVNADVSGGPSPRHRRPSRVSSPAG